DAAQNSPFDLSSSVRDCRHGTDRWVFPDFVRKAITSWTRHWVGRIEFPTLVDSRRRGVRHNVNGLLAARKAGHENASDVGDQTSLTFRANPFVVDSLLDILNMRGGMIVLILPA